MNALTIGTLASEGGVGVETIRYYQRRGLLETPARADLYGGIRRYGEDDLRRLRFIRSAQAAGFTLEQIAELLALDATDDRARARSSLASSSSNSAICSSVKPAACAERMKRRRFTSGSP